MVQYMQDIILHNHENVSPPTPHLDYFLFFSYRALGQLLWPSLYT